MDAPAPLSPDIDPARLVPVVVGSHLRAEIGDRFIAARVAAQLDRALAARAARLRACPLTDVWYLNDERFRDRPAISVGAPDVNALTAYLADKLPSVLSQQQVYIVQLDLEFDRLDAACWGSTHDATAAACELFIDRHLDRYATALAARSLADAER